MKQYLLKTKHKKLVSALWVGLCETSVYSTFIQYRVFQILSLSSGFFVDLSCVCVCVFERNIGPLNLSRCDINDDAKYPNVVSY